MVVDRSETAEENDIGPVSVDSLALNSLPAPQAVLGMIQWLAAVSWSAYRGEAVEEEFVRAYPRDLTLRSASASSRGKTVYVLLEAGLRIYVGVSGCCSTRLRRVRSRG